MQYSANNMDQVTAALAHIPNKGAVLHEFAAPLAAACQSRCETAHNPCVCIVIGANIFLLGLVMLSLLAAGVCNDG
jgi:hypothetical protein